MQSKLLDRRSSHVVWKTYQLARTHTRVINSFEPIDITLSKESFEEPPQLEMQLTPLKSRPNIRVIKFNKLEDSPDRLATEDSEIYKQYTRLPLNKENDSKPAPSSLMNELLLFSVPRTPAKRAISSRVRMRPLLYVP
mmetsp:Transcript_5253/g.9643  ORF Transcript_5253/g.9643 Transcript_5253/m.9643 type:complete len:138 (+) Transcript_5253:122-535(+)